MEKENPPPYSANPPPAGFVAPPYSQPPLQPMGPPHPQPQQHVTHVIINNPPIVNFGPQPQSVTCPSCQAQITTTVKTEATTKTHLIALLLCLFQCYCCCCIPYCVDSCQAQNHYCPNCKAFLGSYKS